MVKRDRWDSSSESENESKPKVESSIAIQTHHTKIEKWHNPLLQGCRSVYDTYDRIGRVSEGTYGVVWKARDYATKEIVALKQIKLDVADNEGGFPVTALREIGVLLELSHESIVSAREMVVGDRLDQVYMVMEYMEMDLQEALKRCYSDSALSQAELKGILQSIVRGAHHLHSKWYLHRDLKPTNILVHRSGRVALCDFGLARRYQEPRQAMTQLVVTLWYRAPELLFGEDKYGPAIDMWSIGCILGELVRGQAILQGQGELDQMDRIFTLLGAPTHENWPDFDKLPHAGIFRWKRPKDEPPEIASKFPINAPVSHQQAFLDGNGYKLLTQLLTLDPAKRITAEEALKHDYFTKGVQPAVPHFFANAPEQ